MAVKTYLEQLESVQAAIAAIESGAQEYSVSANKRIRRADLPALYQREKYLRAMVDREAYGSEVLVKWGE